MQDNVKVLSKNGYKADPAKGGFEEQVLDKDEMKAFRMLAARLNYIAQDDPTIQFAASGFFEAQEIGPFSGRCRGCVVGVPLAE